MLGLGFGLVLHKVRLLFPVTHGPKVTEYEDYGSRFTLFSSFSTGVDMAYSAMQPIQSITLTF